MKKVKITTPENIEVEYTLADLGSRTAAALIDMMVIGIVLLVLAISLLIIGFSAPQLWKDYYGWIVGISILLYAIVVYGYFIALELSMNGRTLGKKVLRLRAIRKNGEPITLKHSAIRNLFRIFIDLFGIGAVSIFLSKDRKRLGDYAASTIVISENTKSRPITLEDLQRVKDNYSYYLSEEEYSLIRDYFARQLTIEDNTQIQKELKAYFTRKFEASGNLEEWKEFIDKL